MLTKEQLIEEVYLICVESHRQESGCIQFECEGCKNSVYIAEAGNESLWKLYEKGCKNCGKEFNVKLGECEF